jgi:hypothetical protein
MASLLDSMMSQLLSKDVLYEPLQHICARVRCRTHAGRLQYWPLPLCSKSQSTSG